MTINIEGAVLLVTCVNGGLGREWVRQAFDRGAAKVYASARTPRDRDERRVVAVPLDVTSDASIQAAAREASDTTIVINNAGVLTHELLSTNTFRLELAPQGIHMRGLHLAHTDTRWSGRARAEERPGCRCPAGVRRPVGGGVRGAGRRVHRRRQGWAGGQHRRSLPELERV
jgi:hypothetical protein